MAEAAREERPAGDLLALALAALGDTALCLGTTLAADWIAALGFAFVAAGAGAFAPPASLAEGLAKLWGALLLATTDFLGLGLTPEVLGEVLDEALDEAFEGALSVALDEADLDCDFAIGC